MDPVRDLGRIEPWQESLERSRARRAKASQASANLSPPSAKPPQRSVKPSRPSVKRSRPSVKRNERRPQRALAQSASRRGHKRLFPPRAAARRQPTDRRRTEKRKLGHPRMLLIGAGGIFTVVSLLAVMASAPGGREAPASLTAAKGGRGSASARSGSDGAGPEARWIVPRAAGLVPGCRATSRPSHYVNPLARAHLKPERIDQGVDYAGSGSLSAIGAARITYVATYGAGWPGAFIEYRLLDGAYAGCYVYYAEGVNPAAGLRVGQTVAAGQPIASIISGWATGIELGWGAGISTMTYAAKTHQWNATSDANSKASAAGKSFSALIASLGGPPGKVEG